MSETSPRTGNISYVFHLKNNKDHVFETLSRSSKMSHNQKELTRSQTTPFVASRRMLQSQENLSVLNSDLESLKLCDIDRKSSLFQITIILAEISSSAQRLWNHGLINGKG